MNSSLPTVSKLIKRSKKSFSKEHAFLEEGESMLSSNKVTGLCLNFPIAETCSPSKLCVKTCYFARGGASWPAALKRQYRIYNTVKADPKGSALRLKKELLAMKSPPTFIRWNGGGDLFGESVQMINHFAKLMPKMPIWVVTRLPVLAAQIKEAQNVYIHFSIDIYSKDRLLDFQGIKKKSANYFFSYQCEINENPSPAALKGMSVIFYDKYKPPEKLPKVSMKIICPLNMSDDITGICEKCRRCFNGEAVKHSKKQTYDHLEVPA
jgi:hypothetical protein